MSVTLYLAIPCYNEETVLPETARRLREKFTALRAAGTIGPMSRICFIDDGSKDATWQLIPTCMRAIRPFPVSACRATAATRTRCCAA